MLPFTRVFQKVERPIRPALLFGILAFYCVFVPLIAHAQAIPNSSQADLVYINAVETKNYLDFPGSPIKQMVKVNVSYKQNNGDGSYGQERPYEDLWYQGQHTLGLRRYRDFDLHTRDSVYIQTQASTPAEIAALANALVRILLDSKLNRNSIIAVTVPSASFWPLADQLEIENFYKPGRFSGRPPVYITLPLFSDDGHKVTVVYSPSASN